MVAAGPLSNGRWSGRSRCTRPDRVRPGLAARGGRASNPAAHTEHPLSASPFEDSASPDSFEETADQEVLEHFEKRIQAASDACKIDWDQAESNWRFYHGGEDAWDKADWKARKSSQRPTFSMPDVTLAVNALSGKEQTNRVQPTFLSRFDEAAEVADVLREWHRQVTEEGRETYVNSDAFRNLAIEGQSWIERNQVFDGRPRGRMEKTAHHVWQMIWDSTSQKQNRTDRMWDAWGDWVGIDDFLMEHPDQKKTVQDQWLGNKTVWVDPTQSTATNRWPWLYRTEGKYIYQKHREVFQVTYEWKEREPAFLTMIPPGCAPSAVSADELGQMLQAQAQYQRDLAQYQQAMQAQQQAPPPGAPGPDGQPAPPAAPPGPPPQAPTPPPPIPEPDFPAELLSKDEWKQYQADYGTWYTAHPDLAQQFGLSPQPDALGPKEGKYRWKFMRASIAGNKVLKVTELPYRQFSRACMTAFPFSQMGKTSYFTLVDLMRDPQVFKNYLYSMGVSLLQRSQKGGMLHKPRFFTDPADAEKRMSHPYPFIAVEQGANFQTDYKELGVSTYPTGLNEWLQTADEAAWRPTGLNPASLGSLPDPRRVSGTVIQSLAGASSIVLAQLSDSYELYLKYDGELFLGFTRAYYEPSDIARVVGPEKAGFIPPKEKWATLLTNRQVVVSNTATSVTEKQAAWEMFSRQGTLDKLLDSGNMPIEIYMEFIPDEWLSPEKKALWKQLLEQKKQAAAAAQTVQPKPPSQVITYPIGKGPPAVDQAIANEIAGAVGALPKQ